MKLDCHMHTPLCGHASGHPVEYVSKGSALGLDLMTFTCHIPMSDPDFGGPRIRMAHHQLEDYFRMVEQARVAGEEHGIEILCGIEAEVSADSGALDEMIELLNAHEFDFVLGSLHHQLKAYRDRLKRLGINEDDQIIRDYFNTLTQAAASGLYHSMSHPDVIRIYGTIDSASFCPEAYEGEIRAFLQSCVRSDTCMEVNTSGLSKGVYTLHPDPIILKWAREEGVKLTLGSDAHAPESVGQHFEKVLTCLQEEGFTTLHYYRSGQQQTTALTGFN